MDIKSEILKQLEKHRGEYLSGEGLSASLGVTRQAVWKAIKKLVSEGYIINSVTNKGYMLDGKCDLLSSAVIAERTGARVYCFDEVGSTNTIAMQKLNDGECIVVAESQSMGRTKNGDLFTSPSKKGVYMSVGLKCSFPLEKTEYFKGRLAEGIALNLGDCCGTMPQVIGGNELFINGKKVCGILLEGEVNLSINVVKNLVVGIGVYISDVGEELGHITATEPRNALVCKIYNTVKEILN